MEYKQGQINEIIGTALHLAGKVAGKVAAGALKGGKKGKASFQTQVQKAKNFDANKAIVNKTKRDDAEAARGGIPLTSAQKKSNKTNAAKADRAATRTAAGQVGNAEKAKSESKNAIASVNRETKSINKLTKAKEKNEDAKIRASINDSFNLTFISEGRKKTERQYKNAHTKGDFPRMVELARRYKSQKKKSLNRKALRDVIRDSEGEVNEGLAKIKRQYKNAHTKEDFPRMVKLAKKYKSKKEKSLDRKALRDVIKHSEGEVNEGQKKLRRMLKSEKHLEKNRGRDYDVTLKKLGLKLRDGDSRKKSGVHKLGKKDRDSVGKVHRDLQAAESKRQQKSNDEVSSPNQVQDKSYAANRRGKPLNFTSK